MAGKTRVRDMYAYGTMSVNQCKAVLCKDGDEDDKWDVGEEGDESHDATAETPCFSVYLTIYISTQLCQNH